MHIWSQKDYEERKAQHEAARAMESARTLEEHDAFLRTLGTGDADHQTRRKYMQEHGLEYRYQPDGRRALEHSEAKAGAYAAKQAQDGPHNAMPGEAKGQGSRGEPLKMFSRMEILAILRGRLATLRASAPDVHEAARFEIEYVIRIFENLE